MDSGIPSPRQQTESTRQHLATMQSLYDNNLYQQAYALGVSEFGKPETWPSPELRLLGARILAQLGALRLADAGFLRLWRSGWRDPELIRFYLVTVHRRRGPLATLDHIQAIRQSTAMVDELERDLLIEEASVYTVYRDYAAAEGCIDRARALQHDRWTEFQRVELKCEEDKYEEALDLAQDMNSEYPNYRSGLQQQARLLQLLGRSEEAIALLEQYFPSFESWWMGAQLFGLLVEGKHFDRAARCLQAMERLMPQGAREVELHRDRLQADLLCAQGRYQEAVPFLHQKNFFSDRVKSSIERSGSEAARKIIEVPFVRQAHMTCAPASLTAVSRYWGREVSQAEIVEAICYGGTQNYDERNWAIENDWYAVEFDLNFEALKSLIDIEVPVLLATVEPGSAHLQIIVGYDENMGTYLLRDPYYPRLQEFLIGETENYYAANGPRCLVVAPQSLKEAIEQTPLTNRRLYDAVFKMNMALRNNDRERAQAIVMALTKNSPKERLALMSERSLAIYDGDEDRILNATENLLRLFPSEINLQLSKLASLNQIGASTEALTYLRSITDGPNPPFLLLSRLARAISWDHRLTEETDRLYQRLLKRSPTHVNTLYGYAGTLWDKQEYQRAYLLYRFCACLEDTEEGYAESYFKAARFNRETDVAIDFLVDRFRRFGSRDSGPAISLFNALDALNRTDQAYEYLEQALELLPANGHLRLFAARQYTYQGNVSRGMELLEAARDQSRAVNVNEVAVELYEATLDTEKARQACKDILVIEPLNHFANNAYARLLVEAGRRGEAVGFIRSQLERFPGNLMLQKLLARWLDPGDTAAIAAVYQEICENHPMDAAAFRRLSELQISQERYDQALQSALTAVEINKRDAENYGYLGDAYLAKNDRANAREAFREAVRVSCDYSYAYERLMSCSFDIEQQRQDLDFIHGELMRQVSYGAGILDFQALAKRYLAEEKVFQFLEFALQQRPDLWQSWVAMIIHLRGENHLQQALDIANEAVDKFPLLPRLYLEKAEVLRVMHEFDAAIEMLKKTLELSPGWVKASNALCDLYEKQGNYQAAIDLQELAIKRSPLVPSPLGYLADLYARLEEDDKAIDCLRRAVDLDHDYVWAWERLYYLENKRGNGEQVLEKMRGVIDKSSHNVELLESYVDVTGGDDSAVKLLEAHLLDYPNDVDICVKLCNCYVRRGNFDRAHSIVSDVYWNNTRPLVIVSSEAWIYARQNNLVKAVTIMEGVAEKQPNYYDAWRLLANWNAQLRNREKLEQAVANCARIAPHNADVLCFCAEKLKEAGAEGPQMMEYLKHSFELDPTDQYNALTYIDELIDAGDLDEADAVCRRTLQFNANPYVYLRTVKVALAQKHIDKALQDFDKSLDDSGQNNDIVYIIWRALAAADQQQQAAEIIQQALAQGRALSADTGKCIGLYELDTLGVKKVEARLKKQTMESAYDQRYLEAYIRTLIDLEKVMPWELESKLLPFIRQDLTNWGLYGYCLFRISGREAQACSVWEGIDQQRDAEAWIIYFYSMAQRWIGHWTEGEALIQRAYDLPADRYRDDILLWIYFDHLIAGGDLDPELLAHLDHADLEPMSKYVVVATKALVQDTNFVDGYEQLSPLLRECQRRYQPLVGNPVIETVKKRLAKHLRERLPQQSLVKGWVWRWKLSNHF